MEKNPQRFRMGEIVAVFAKDQVRYQRAIEELQVVISYMEKAALQSPVRTYWSSTTPQAQQEHQKDE